jgi:hypothetical protein
LNWGRRSKKYAGDELPEWFRGPAIAVDNDGQITLEPRLDAQTADRRALFIPRAAANQPLTSVRASAASGVLR